MSKIKTPINSCCLWPLSIGEQNLFRNHILCTRICKKRIEVSRPFINSNLCRRSNLALSVHFDNFTISKGALSKGFYKSAALLTFQTCNFLFHLASTFLLSRIAFRTHVWTDQMSVSLFHHLLLTKTSHEFITLLQHYWNLKRSIIVRNSIFFKLQLFYNWHFTFWRYISINK